MSWTSYGLFVLASLALILVPGPDMLFLLGLMVNMLAIAVNLILVTLSAKISRSLRGNPRIARRLQSAMGILFIALGARLATERL